MDVWTYWAGPKPDWIDICLRSIAKYCRQSTFHLLTPDDLPSEVESSLNDRWKELPPGVGTDCLRAALLSKHGGLWVDADTVCIRDPAELLCRHRREEFLYSTWTKPPRRVVAGYVYSPPGHPIALRWLEGVNSALRHAQNIGWGEIGEKMLTPMVEMHPRDTWEMARETFLPVDIDSDVEKFFRPGNWRACTTRNTIGFALNYSWMQEHRAADMVNTGDLMVQRLLREVGGWHADRQ